MRIFYPFSMQKTLILLKPDTVQRSLVGTIIARLEVRSLTIRGLKMMNLSEALLTEHYGHLASKPFFPAIVSFMTSSPVVALIVEGPDAVAVVRSLCGATNPLDALPGTIRGDFARNIDNNIIHASDSVETAAAEIKRFFKDEEIFSYARPLASL